MNEITDTQRLDWLQKQMQPVTEWSGNPSDEPELVAYCWRVEGQCVDVRDAIDAEMPADSEQPKP